MRSSLLSALTFTLPLPIAALVGQRPEPFRDVGLSVLATIPDVPNLENLALRSNGDIIVSSSGSPLLHLVSPTGKRVSVIATIPDTSSLTGIAELEKDVFYVAGANVTGTQPTAVGTNVVWRVDLRGLGIAVNGTVTNPAKTSLVAKIPTAGLLNGMTRLSPNDTSRLLLSDSALGRVLSLDVETKAYETVIEDETTAGRPERLVAVNGIRTHGNDLFYVNQVRNLFFKVPISMSTGRPVGPAEVLANGTVPFADDFALSQDAKRAWIALNSQNVIVEVDVAARTSTVIVNSTTLGEGSSVAVTGDPGPRSLYVTGSTVVGSVSVGAVFRLDG